MPPSIARGLARRALGDEPWGHDLFNVLRRLDRESSDRPRIGTAVRRNDDPVTLEQDPYLAFPASTISRADADDAGRLRVAVQFLGLLGPQGPLPLSVTEETYRWQLESDDAFARFLDVFNHRFIELFFRAWGDSRPVVHRDRPADDRFLRYVGAVIGLGLPADDPPDSVPAVALAAYAGLLSPRVKSASRLGSFLAGLFDVEVEVEEFVPSLLPLEIADQSQLGHANSALGVDMMLGSTVLSFDEKVRLRVFAPTLGEYITFLPDGPNARRVADAIAFYLGDEFDWDIELALPVAEAPAMALGSAGRLGWTAWMMPQNPSQRRAILADARFRPAPRPDKPSTSAS